jgi:hypothetical protein
MASILRILRKRSRKAMLETNRSQEIRNNIYIMPNNFAKMATIIPPRIVIIS